MSNERIYELPLTRDYVRHWGLAEAVRELIQNALDSDSPFEYSFGDNSLTITSRFSTLDAKTLLLGATSKAGQNDKIGSFGEGYKIALLVLTRLGKPVAVLNGDRHWTPHFRHSEAFGSEVFAIRDEVSAVDNQGLEFTINGLTQAEIDKIRASCLMMQPPMTDVIGAKQGHILPSRPGKLYVGSLYVCDTKLKYGYDIQPEYLRLERDRQTVSGFDLQWLAKEVWFSTQRWEQIAELMEAGIPDLEYAEHGCPELVKEACYRQFTKSNPGAIAVRNQQEMEAAVAKGLTKTVYVTQSYGTAIASSSGFRSSTVAVKMREKSPQEVLAAWGESKQRMMSHPLRLEFRRLLDMAKGWRTS